MVTAQALEDGSATVIDVREPYEWEAGRIAGVRHIPLERLAAEAVGTACFLDREYPMDRGTAGVANDLHAAAAVVCPGIEDRV